MKNNICLKNHFFGRVHSLKSESKHVLDIENKHAIATFFC